MLLVCSYQPADSGVLDRMRPCLGRTCHRRMCSYAVIEVLASYMWN